MSFAIFFVIAPPVGRPIMISFLMIKLTTNVAHGFVFYQSSTLDVPKMTQT